MYRILFITFLFAIIAISGCASTGNPVTTPDQAKSPNQSATEIPFMVESQGTGSGIMGLFQVSIDPLNLKGEITPLRKSSLDDALEMVDITNFLRLVPCTDCVKLFGIGLDPDGHIQASIGVKHPFPAGDPFKPISGKNRADLHVFNVEGTVIFDDSSGTVSFSGLGEKLGPIHLLNADGYSNYLDPAIDEIYLTEATMHPYVLHFDDYSSGNFNPANPTGFESVTNPPPSGNLVMPMGCDYDKKDYIFIAPDNTSFDFIYAVGCTYAVSASNKSQRFTPAYQVPQHNKKAASEVSVEVTENMLAPGDTSSSAQLTVKILDISHGVAVGDGADQMKADSSVAAIYVEVPGVTASPAGGPVSPSGGDGRDPLNPLTFSVSFSNTLGAAEGTYTGLVKVLDSYPAGSNESPLLAGMDAIKRVGPIENPLSGLFSLDEFATYMPITIEISMTSHAPQASYTTEPIGTPDLVLNYLDTVTFTSTSTDPDDPLTPAGQIVSYEWDFEWDGVPANFVDDTAGAGSDVEIHQFTLPGIYRVGLRVTDGGTPPLTSDIFSIQVNVNAWTEEYTIDQSNGRVPKTALMKSGKIMLIWSGSDNQNHYSVFDGTWSASDIMSTTTTNYLSIYPGPGDDEVWAAGGVRWFRYTGGTGLWTMVPGEIGSCVQTQIFPDGNGGYNVIMNSNSAFGWVIRIHWADTIQYYSDFYQYIVYLAYNNRLMGESRILDANSSGQVCLVYKQDLAIDPYQPPQDYRYVLSAIMNPQITGYTSGVIDEGANDVLDSVAIACDTSDKWHTAYRSQPNGGGNYSIFYKSSTNNTSSWGSKSSIWTGTSQPEYEYISIDTDSNNNIIVTYRIDAEIYWVYSSDGVTWSTPEIVNVDWPGGVTSDKEQYMVVDSTDQTHVVWDRCPTGSLGTGPIKHRMRAPIG